MKAPSNRGWLDLAAVVFWPAYLFATFFLLHWSMLAILIGVVVIGVVLVSTIILWEIPHP